MYSVVVKSFILVDRRPGFEFKVRHRTLLCLSFLICKMEILTVLTSEDCGEGKIIHSLSAVLGL